MTLLKDKSGKCPGARFRTDALFLLFRQRDNAGNGEPLVWRGSEVDGVEELDGPRLAEFPPACVVWIGGEIGGYAGYYS